MDNHQQTASTCIVIVNWKNPWDTLECLESVLCLDQKNWVAFVCDNDSQDGSIDIFKKWAERRVCVSILSPPTGLPQASPPLDNEFNVFFEKPLSPSTESRVNAYPAKSIVFIENDKNAGFAGGNNVGLKFALSHPEARWIWLLNNDTIVEPSALDWQIKRSQAHARPHMIGVTIMEYYQPQNVQYNGGASYNHFTTQVRPIRQDVPPHELAKNNFEAKIESQISYISGASMFLPMSTLKIIGLMDERYFLYYEELDWIARHRATLDLLYASRAVIYHKEGGTTGGKTTQKIKSTTSEYYSARSRLMYTLKHRPSALVTVIPIQIFALLKRALINRQTENAKIVWKASLDAIKMHRSIP